MSYDLYRIRMQIEPFTGMEPDRPLTEQIYQAVGSDEALYPEIRELAYAVQGCLTERVRKV
jgi:hypothetical protein